MEFYSELKEKFRKILEKENLLNDEVSVITKSLTPEEAIGKTERKDFPILNGKEIMIEAEYKGNRGQAFTSSPCNYSGSLKEISELDLSDDYNKSIFISSMNAVLLHLGLISGNIHCKNEEPEMCAKSMREYMEENYRGKKVVLVGFQPAMLENIKEVVDLRVLDLNEDNVNTEKYGVMIEDGVEKYEEAVLDWADAVLCTGSTVLNGSIVNFIDIGKPVIFYGTSISGTAYLMNLTRLCYYPG